MRRGVQLNLPFQHASARCCRLRLFDVSGPLQGNGQRRMRQRIVRSQSGESQGRGDRLLQPSGIAQCANQAMVSFNVVWVVCNGRTEGLGCLNRQPGSQQVNAMLGEQFSGLCVGFRHVCYQHNGYADNRKLSFGKLAYVEGDKRFNLPKN